MRIASWAITTAAAAVLMSSGAAFAGSCPEGSMTDASGGQQAGATAPKGVTDEVIGSIDLASEPAAIQGRQFRLRRLEVQPGGVVPWHSHEDRPAIIYVVQGSVTEYASTCAVPIVHMAGDVAVESHTISHWWKNTSDQVAVLLSADLLHTGDEASMM
jgi:quercetin dioxygenase-like cupin family protein